jgi:hypothetical protein
MKNKRKIWQGIYVHIHSKGQMDNNGLKLLLEILCDQCMAHTTEVLKRTIKELNKQLAVIP